MRKNLLLIVLSAFAFSFICSCAPTSELHAKRKGSGCNTRAGMAKKAQYNAIQYR